MKNKSIETEMKKWMRMYDELISSSMRIQFEAIALNDREGAKKFDKQVLALKSWSRYLVEDMNAWKNYAIMSGKE